MLPHAGQAREAPDAGEIFRQADLAATLRKLVEAEATALTAGKSRKEALQAAYDRFYRGDVAEEFVRGAREEGALVTKDDLANWQVRLEEPVPHELSRHRRLQARPLDPGPGDAAGAQHPRELRPQGDGLQQRALHPHRVPGDEPRLRRSRLLLRRSVLPARGADPGPALEGLREGARGSSSKADARTTPRSAPATRIRSRAARIPSTTC